MFPSGLPRTGSHEGTGTVVQVGSKVDNFKKGDRIMSGIPRNQCQSCVNCKGELDDFSSFRGPSTYLKREGQELLSLMKSK